MIRIVKGNLLDASAEALVNTVNEVGVMGKGIAAMFRDAFPHNTEVYERAAKAKTVAVGKMLVTENPEVDGPRWIINFPTKRHWRQPSRLEWIKSGLTDLRRVIQERGIRSIALPPLGCGNGGLDWSDVKHEIVKSLESLEDVKILLYEPISEYQQQPKKSGVEKLTVARALIAELVRRYGVLGLDCTILEVQKLAWFVAREIRRERLKDPLRLKFSADKYGPYDDRLRHLLDSLDGSYLHSAKRLADATPTDLIWFDPTRADKLSEFLRSREAKNYTRVLERTGRIIEGFESPFGMELLATVDWLLSRQDVDPQLDKVREGLSNWPGGKGAAVRKLKLFDDRVLSLALTRLVEREYASTSPSLFD